MKNHIFGTRYNTTGFGGKFKDNLSALKHLDRLFSSLATMVYKVSRELLDKNGLVLLSPINLDLIKGKLDEAFEILIML